MLTLLNLVRNALAGALLAVFFTHPLLADSPVGTPEYPECTKDGKPIIPEAFWDELDRQEAEEDELGLRPWAEYEVLEEAMRQGKGPGEWFHVDRTKKPDFKERLEKWRLEQGLPATVECPPPEPESMEMPLSNQAAIAGITTVPQHSKANNIFRKKRISIDIYDTGRLDGDAVDIYFNGRFHGHYVLPAKALSTSLILNLEPSDILPLKTNVITFVGTASGSSEKLVTLGVSARPSQIFTGSYLAPLVGAAQTEALIPVGGSASLNLALGLACVDEAAYPQSAKHIEDAQALGYARIVSVDRANATKRRNQNVPSWKKKNPNAAKACKVDPLINPSGESCDVDEYPLAMFAENQAAVPGLGKPHMRAIPASDNQGSGSTIGSYARPYLDADPTSRDLNKQMPDNLEIIVQRHGSPLYCRNAF